MEEPTARQVDRVAREVQKAVSPRWAYDRLYFNYYLSTSIRTEAGFLPITRHIESNVLNEWPTMQNYAAQQYNPCSRHYLQSPWLINPRLFRTRAFRSGLVENMWSTATTSLSPPSSDTCETLTSAKTDGIMVCLRHSATTSYSRAYCTVMLTVAVLLVRLGSGVSSMWPRFR